MVVHELLVCFSGRAWKRIEKKTGLTYWTESARDFIAYFVYWGMGISRVESTCAAI